MAFLFLAECVKNQRRNPIAFVPFISDLTCNMKYLPISFVLNSKNTITVLLLVTCIQASGQDNVSTGHHITRYFDSEWIAVPKEQAFFFTEMRPTAEGYACRSFWAKSGKLNAVGTFADTLFGKGKGLFLRYYENGQTEDSITFNPDGVVIQTFHYYPDGKLHAHKTFDPVSKKEKSEGFLPNGTRIEDFVFSTAPIFPDTDGGFTGFINENLNSEVPVTKGAPAGKFEVQVRFMISRTGKLTNTQPLTAHGFGMEEEVIRVFKRSPKWQPAVLLGKPIDSWFVQPVIFILKESKRRR
jgi:hypothetical protein